MQASQATLSATSPWSDWASRDDINQCCMQCFQDSRSSNHVYFITCLFMSIWIIWDNALRGCEKWFNEKTRLGRTPCITITCPYAQTHTTREKYSHTSASGRDFTTCLGFGVLQAWLKYALPLSRLTLGPILGPVPMRKSLSKTGWQMHALLCPLSQHPTLLLVELRCSFCLLAVAVPFLPLLAVSV